MTLLKLSVLVFALLFSCTALRHSSLSPVNCTYSSSYVDQSIKLPPEVETLLPASEVSSLEFVYRLVQDRTLSVDENETSCALQRIENKLYDIDIHIRSSIENAKLDRRLIDVQNVFDGLGDVTYAFRMLLKHNEPSTRREMRVACRKHSPFSILRKFSKRVHNHPKLFQSIVEGTGYYEALFDNVTAGMITETAISAILAPKCIKKKNQSPSPALMRDHKIEIEGILKAIRWEYDEAKTMLRTKFHARAAQDLKDHLHYITKHHFLLQTGANYVEQRMSEKYPFRAWAIVLYKYIRKEATRAHYRSGTSNDWFYIENGHYTLIAHSANREYNCSFFGSKIRGKHLRDFFASNAEYAEFAANNGEELWTASDLLRERLQPELPQNYFISIVTARSDLKEALEAHREFHFFERVQFDGRVTKFVLIGWC